MTLSPDTIRECYLQGKLGVVCLLLKVSYVCYDEEIIKGG